jgi:hypothetical protein
LRGKFPLFSQQPTTGSRSHSRVMFLKQQRHSCELSANEPGLAVSRLKPSGGLFDLPIFAGLQLQPVCSHQSTPSYVSYMLRNAAKEQSTRHWTYLLHLLTTVQANPSKPFGHSSMPTKEHITYRTANQCGLGLAASLPMPHNLPGPPPQLPTRSIRAQTVWTSQVAGSCCETNIHP